MTLAPGTHLGPYEVTDQIGSGGMGIVYEARDPRLKRTVAIKLLPPDLTSDDTAKQRFLQEAQAASALDHPNICTIHDVGETDDSQLYLVMAHYEGETLKERIARGPVPVDEAVEIATQVGQGLAKAHGARIVHRDIKPANLMVTTDGTVKILDFGLAKLAGLEGVTQTGTTVGTVAYMSPEQARGEEVDHRTDIWSLGVVLYEMLAGQPPFQGENLLSLAEAIRSEEPERLSGDARPLNHALVKALDKNQEQRYQAIAELLTELRSPSTSPEPVPAAEPGMASIAVLPFVDMSPEKDNDYFCEGMAEEIINALSTLQTLKVASRTSSFQFKGQSEDIRRIGEVLGVQAVLEGSVRTSGKRLRVTAQLISIDDGFQAWTERYDRQMEDVFDIQDEIAQSITEALQLRLVDGSAAPKVERYTADLDAYHLYLQGRHQWFSRPRGWLGKALRRYEDAIEKDPSYAPAHAGVAQAHAISGFYGLLPPKAVFSRAKTAAERGLAGGAAVAEAHVAMGLIRLAFDWDIDAADASFKQAINLEPNSGVAHVWHATALVCAGRLSEGEQEASLGLELEPRSPYISGFAAGVSFFSRQHERALDRVVQALEQHPDYVLLLFIAGGACGALSRHDQAIAYMQRAVIQTDRLPLYLGLLGQAYAHGGRRAEAESTLEELLEQNDRQYVPPLTLALVAMALGDADRAFAWLEQEYRDRGILIWSANVAWWFDDLRSDPRFPDLLRRMNLPERGRELDPAD